MLGPILTAISSAAADVSLIGGAILLVFVGIFAGRATARPAYARRYSRRLSDVQKMDQGKAFAKRLMGQPSHSIKPVASSKPKKPQMPRNFNNSGSPYQPKQKRTYKPKPISAQVLKNINDSRKSIREAKEQRISSRTAINPKNGPHSKRLYEHKKQAKSYNDKYTLKGSELQAWRNATPEQKRRLMLGGK